MWPSRLMIWGLVVGVLVLGALPIGLYFIAYDHRLSSSYDAWSSFGQLSSAFMSGLGFLGILLSLQQGKEAQTRIAQDQERANIYHLIDFHFTRLAGISLEDDDATHSGASAISILLKRLQGALTNMINQLAENWICFETDSCPQEGIELVAKWGRSSNPRFQTSDGELLRQEVMNWFGTFSTPDEKTKALRKLLRITSRPDSEAQEIIAQLNIIGSRLFQRYSLEDRIGIVAGAFDTFYLRYGQYFGHYFRNMHYVLEEIRKSRESDEFRRVYRAQLTRDEIALLFFNCLGAHSRPRFLANIVQFKLLDDIEAKDLAVLCGDIPQKGEVQGIVGSYLEEKARMIGGSGSPNR